MNTPYIPGTNQPPELPLGRFLPPIPKGMVRNWCQKTLQPDQWVFDPFGFSPLLAIEVANTGHSILVAANNPIHAFLIKVIASAPKKEALTAALQDLATSTKGQERMESYIRSFYAVTCADCGRQIEADAFLWKKGDGQPYAALVDCPFCGARGEQTLSANVLLNIEPLPPIQMHRARALNRIVDWQDPLRTQVENALGTYPPRPLIVLQTIINKLDSLNQTPYRRELLIALILSAADKGNTLWAHPTPRERPRQIVIPSVYKEQNLWKALENGLQTWQEFDTPTPVYDWEGDFNQTSAIFLYKGRSKELELPTNDTPLPAILTVIPRPNQAFWTLSALWTGWIWGQEAVNPIRQVLARQRYDWNWHTLALGSVFESLNDVKGNPLPVYGLIAENEPLLLLATLLAADLSGYRLTGFAQSQDDLVAQCNWQRANKPANISIPPNRALVEEKLRAFIETKGEPANYQQIHAAAVGGLANENQLAIDAFLESKHQTASETQRWLESIIEDNPHLYRLPDETSSIETGDWWLKDPSNAKAPLIDRIEAEIIQHLIEEKTTSAEAVKALIYEAFPGILTPNNLVILNCLESYADQIDQQNHTWQLRQSETPAARKADIQEIRKSLSQIGKRLEYKVQEHVPLIWLEDEESPAKYHFHVFASAMVSKHIEKSSADSTKRVLVLPGSRANLLAFKTQRDPILAEKLDRDYLILKFRQVRDLEANPLLTRDLFEKQIHTDQPEYRDSQLALF